MPANPIAPDPHLQRLVDEGFEVIVEGDYLIVDGVPYVASPGKVESGALICAYLLTDGVPRVNTDHQCWFTGTIPCAVDGTSLASILVSDPSTNTVAGRTVHCHLSNKPDPIGDFFDNHYNKVMHYVRKITRHAWSIDPSACAVKRGEFHFRQKPTVFLYPNDAIATSGLDAYADKVRLRRVCIIGVGGTGSYLLDALAKEEIEQIDLYDHDIIERKNAFRMPGALTHDEAHAELKKAEFLASRYSVMRSGIAGHAIRIDASNVGCLDGADFVFIAIDHGPSRGLIARYLVDRGIAFIDVGIGVDKVSDSTSLIARARVTLVTPETAAVLDQLPTADDTDDAIYNNIQILELNALNAMLAVIRFKQHLGFYVATNTPTVIKYVSSWNELRCSGAS